MTDELLLAGLRAQACPTNVFEPFFHLLVALELVAPIILPVFGIKEIQLLHCQKVGRLYVQATRCSVGDETLQVAHLQPEEPGYFNNDNPRIKRRCCHFWHVTTFDITLAMSTAL